MRQNNQGVHESIEHAIAISIGRLQARRRFPVLKLKLKDTPPKRDKPTRPPGFATDTPTKLSYQERRELESLPMKIDELERQQGNT